MNSFITKLDESYMDQALALAKISADLGEVPVGAVLVYEDKVVGTGYNQRELIKSSLAHAEMMAIDEASKHLGRWRLSGCTMYVTLEPCIMCAGALIHARIDRLVYGACDKKFGAIESLYELAADSRLNHNFISISGLRKPQSIGLLQDFFQKLRKKSS